MVWIQGEVEIERPIGEVFAFVADERNEPRYNADMLHVRKRTSGPIGVGTSWKVELASHGRITPMTIDVVDFDPPHRLVSHTSIAAMEIDGALTFEPTERGTRMQWEWSLQPRGARRFAWPIVRRMGARQERRIWTNLKALLESGAE